MMMGGLQLALSLHTCRGILACVDDCFLSQDIILSLPIGLDIRVNIILISGESTTNVRDYPTRLIGDQIHVLSENCTYGII